MNPSTSDISPEQQYVLNELELARQRYFSHLVYDRQRQILSLGGHTRSAFQVFWEFTFFDRLVHYRNLRWQADIAGREAPVDPALALRGEAGKAAKEEARRAFQQLSGVERRMYEAYGDLDFEKAKDCVWELQLERRRAARAAGRPWESGGIPRVRVQSKTRMRRRTKNRRRYFSSRYLVLLLTFLFSK
ncbi:hypothetical protein BJ508DRAFT_316339 [Ascobolus immersus RN42]|uniref:Uncharacterized protein n=1 Tax=Ascobolus immersus RN42 TaxID=1160509 RepID=A0A3N4H6S9_ASCIM|nr:hypothetical protein BJ508DRAFT_316339 [Ascobolus immersus RN42]